MRKCLALLGILFLFSSCYKTHLFVQQEWINDSYLASKHVKTPDPRQKNPPFGQKLLIKWDYPLSLYKRDLSLVLTVRFWDNTQKNYVYKLKRKRGYTSYYFPVKSKNKDKEILTYNISVVDKEKQVVERWYHQLWTELIALDKVSSK